MIDNTENLKNEAEKADSPGKTESSPALCHIERATKFYPDVKIKVEDEFAVGCAIDSDLYSRGKDESQIFSQMQDIILLSLTAFEMKGNLEKISRNHLVSFEKVERLADETGYISCEKLKKNEINALFTDHTRMGKIDFMDMEHIASEVRRIDDYTFRHDFTTEDSQGQEPSAWKLLGINVKSNMAYWQSLEEFALI